MIENWTNTEPKFKEAVDRGALVTLGFFVIQIVMAINFPLEKVQGNKNGFGSESASGETQLFASFGRFWVVLAGFGCFLLGLAGFRLLDAVPLRSWVMMMSLLLWFLRMNISFFQIGRKSRDNLLSVPK